METLHALKRMIYPDRGGLHQLRFFENEWLTALVPDQERFGLARELVLQRIYDAPCGLGGSTVIDAGANVGFFSLMASRHAERVVALEPDPINYRVLELNLEINAIGNVTPLRAALWTADGSVDFSRPAHEGGRSVASTASHISTEAPQNGNGVRVEALSLETLVERHGEIDLLKLDIEGAEEQVLPATSALRHVKRLVAELHLSRTGQEQPMLAALRDQGFDARIISSASLYTRSWVAKVLRNWGRLEDQMLIKLGLIAYLLAPVTKPRRPGRDMPLLAAVRQA